jgi:hypothetical protein
MEVQEKGKIAKQENNRKTARKRQEKRKRGKEEKNITIQTIKEPAVDPQADFRHDLTCI